MKLTEMKLTNSEKDALITIHQDGGVDDEECIIHKNTINSLHRKSLITYFVYANCTVWQLTDSGLDKLPKLY